MKKGARKDSGWFIFAIILAIILVVAWIPGEMAIYNLALARYDWTQHDDGPVSRLKLRTICHKIISHRIGNHHDAFIALDHVADRDSIPYLINALRWYEPEAGIDVVDCTTEHCVDCLQKLTGMDFGYSHKEWSEWWQMHGIKLSPEELAGMADNAAKAKSAKTPEK